MLNLAKLVLLGALATGFIGSALATVSGPGSLGDLSGTSVSIGDAFNSSEAGSSFTDLYTFDLSNASQTVGTTVTINLSVGGSSFDLSNMVIEFTDSTGTNVYASDSQNIDGDTLSLNSDLANGADYHFVVTGEVAGAAGGSYAGVLQALPVPEADVYSMFVAGIGLIALRLRNRIGSARRIYA
ncbi:MAG: FxDxF family PEP-CTERM protein [Thiobacillaceae bacterium]